MHLVGWIIAWILQIFMWLLFARMIMSFVPLFNPDFRPKGALLVIFEMIYSITDPPLNLMRKLLPRAWHSAGGFDISFLLLALLVMVLMRINSSVFL